MSAQRAVTVRHLAQQLQDLSRRGFGDGSVLVDGKPVFSVEASASKGVALSTKRDDS